MSHRLQALLVFATLIPAPALQAQTWQDITTWDTVQVTPTRNIVYRQASAPGNPSANPDPGTPGGLVAPAPPSANLPAGKMDLHLDVLQVTSTKPTPVVLQIHGGGWIRGDRPGSYNTFRGFLAAGMSVVTVQYRLGKDAPAPAAIEDVRCALAWVKSNAAKYNFDPTRVITYGESAGGHLALMAAYAPASFNPTGCTDQPKVVAVLDFYGPTNLAEGLTQSGSRDFTHQWLGMDAPLPPGWAGAEKARVQWPEPTAAILARAREMSPVTYVKPGVPPAFIAYGDKDRTVDPQQNVELQQALAAAKVPNEIMVVPGVGHGTFPRLQNDDAKLRCLRFLQTLGILPAAPKS